jgi:hypothetical protein
MIRNLIKDVKKTHNQLGNRINPRPLALWSNALGHELMPYVHAGRYLRYMQVSIHFVVQVGRYLRYMQVSIHFVVQVGRYLRYR